MGGKKQGAVKQWIDRLSNTINCIPWEASAETWQFTYVGPQAVKILGYPVHRWYEEGFWTDHIYEEDRESAIQLCLESSQVYESYEFEYRMVASDGSLVWLHDLVTVESVDGRPKILRGFMIDITESKRAKEALRKSQESLAEAQRVAHLGSWDWDIKTNESVVSNEYRRIYGLDQDAEVSYDAFLDRVHPEDREFVKAEVDRSLAGNEPYSIDHRIILPSGEVRIVHEEAKVFFDEAGNPIRKIGTVHDITDRKQAELKIQEAEGQLRALSRHLIQAQEKERRRIALELHDQLSQDLALVSIELDNLIQKAPQSQAEVVDGLEKLAIQARQLSSQVQNLSHQLHPSQLIHIGLVAASRSLCSEVSKASGIQIDFSHSKVPNSVPQDVSVCLFRVLQESLGNIVKHSGSSEAEVKLTGRPGEIQLHVRDTGVGFDPYSRKDSFGLGLISMQERLESAGGELLIESHPAAGAQIRACVPLVPPSVQTEALRI